MTVNDVVYRVTTDNKIQTGRIIEAPPGELGVWVLFQVHTSTHSKQWIAEQVTGLRYMQRDWYLTIKDAVDKLIQDAQKTHEGKIMEFMRLLETNNA